VSTKRTFFKECNYGIHGKIVEYLGGGLELTPLACKHAFG
jgi:hypothetical protein